jgi:hypothetical protein
MDSINKGELTKKCLTRLSFNWRKKTTHITEEDKSGVLMWWCGREKKGFVLFIYGIVFVGTNLEKRKQCVDVVMLYRR